MATEGVERTAIVPQAAPRAVYDVVVDFNGYPKLFPEIKQARTLSVDGKRHRVEFRAQVVLPVRYVLDLECDPEAAGGPSVQWTFVEGDVVTGMTGGWRFEAAGADTRVTYRAHMEVKAPLPGFVLRKITDGLLSLSIPNMFAAVTREVATRRARPAP